MNGLPEAGIGEENVVGPLEGSEAAGWLARAKKLVGEKMSYALGDQVAFSLGNMVVAALLSRHCAAREFGIYILTQRALDVVLQLSNVFFWAPFIFNLPGTAVERRTQYLGSVTLHQVVACVVAGVAMWGMKLWAHTPERGIYYGVFAPLVFTAAAIMFREFTRRMYFAEMRMREAFWTDVATNGLQIAGVEWLYIAGRLTVANTLWMLSAGAGLVSLWWIVRERKTVAFNLKAAWNDLLTNLRLGRWFFGSNMLFTVSSQCNPWVLSAMLGGVSVGAYAKCEQVVNIPRVALNSMQNIMAPMMARAYADGGKASLSRLVKRLDKMLLGGSVLFAVGIVAFGPFVARVIFHSAPDNARFILILLALNFVAFAATMAQSYGLTAIDRAGKVFYANVIGLAAQVMVTIWLVKKFDVPGAAGAMLIGSVAVVVVRGIYYAREMRAA